MHFVLVVNDERHDAVAEALAEEDEATDTTVAVLKCMDALETPMIFGKGVDGYVLLGIVPLAERLYLHGNIIRFACLTSPGFICQFLVVTYIEV